VPGTTLAVVPVAGGSLPVMTDGDGASKVVDWVVVNVVSILAAIASCDVETVDLDDR